MMENPVEPILPKPFVDPLVEALDVRSVANGRDYEVRIGLPISYRQGDARYPVLIVLDADILFGTAYESATVEALWSRVPVSGATAVVPEVIVVGISLPDRAANPLRRNYEYMPADTLDDLSDEQIANRERTEEFLGARLQTGGAESFRMALETDILPLIERLYRVDTGRRAIFGESAGGTFVIYSLLTNPELFTDYIAISPFVSEGLFQLEAALAEAGKPLPVGLFLSVGEREMSEPTGLAGRFVRFVEQLHSRRRESFRLISGIVPNANHVQAGPACIGRALAMLFR